MDRVVLKFGLGLGDALTKNHLPERYVRERGATVFVSSDTNWRNSDTVELIKRNPFISGFVNEPENVSTYEEITSLNFKYKNTIKAIEAHYGFEPKNSYPKLYNVDLQFKKELCGKTLIDFRSVTVSYSQDVLDKFVHYLEECGIYKSDSLVLTSKTNPNTWENQLTKYETRDIFDYTSSIFSCEKFICVASGSLVMGSAIRGLSAYPWVISLMTTGQWNQHIYSQFKGVDYFLEGQDHDDWRRF